MTSWTGSPATEEYRGSRANAARGVPQARKVGQVLPASRVQQDSKVILGNKDLPVRQAVQDLKGLRARRDNRVYLTTGRLVV